MVMIGFSSDWDSGCRHNNFSELMHRCTICVEADRKWDEEHPREPIDWEKIHKIFILSGEAFAKKQDDDLLKIFMENDVNKDRTSNTDRKNTVPEDSNQ